MVSGREASDEESATSSKDGPSLLSEADMPPFLRGATRSMPLDQGHCMTAVHLSAQRRCPTGGHIRPECWGSIPSAYLQAEQRSVRLVPTARGDLEAWAAFRLPSALLGW